MRGRARLIRDFPYWKRLFARPTAHSSIFLSIALPCASLPCAGFALQAVVGPVKNAAQVEARFHDVLARDAACWPSQVEDPHELDDEVLSQLHALARRGAAALMLSMMGGYTSAVAFDGEEALLNRDLATRAQKALESVPPRPREVIERRLLRGEPLQQVAHDMGITVITVRRDYEEWMGKIQQRLAG